MLRLASLIPVLAIGALGCVETLEEPSLGATEQASAICPKWECGSNSPVIATIGFHELNLLGFPNAEGFNLITLWKSGINYQLDVDRGKLIGRDGAITIAGPALVGAQIRLRRGIKSYAVRITQVSTAQTFARLGGTTRPIETYQLDVSELVNDVPLNEWRNLCSNIPSRDTSGVLGMNNFHALVFEGERINADKKTIGTALDANWFNIGCAGHALAKMALNAHTEAAKQAFGFQTTIPERQAFLKMLTADYCGTGIPFTVPGQPLQWTDWHAYTKYVSSPMNLELEARWTPSGAKCLNTPRIDANPTALGDAVFQGDVEIEIANTCTRPPPCPGGVLWFDSTPVLSANPL